MIGDGLREKKKPPVNYGVYKMETLISKLLEVQQELSHAKASERNPAFGSKFVPYEALWDFAKEACNAKGILIQQVSHESDIGACIETVLYGHGSSLSTGKMQIKADRESAQGFGGAVTYAKRYSLSMALGIGSDKDDDANGSEASTDPNGKVAKYVGRNNTFQAPQAKPPAKKKATSKPKVQTPTTAPDGEFTLRQGDAVLVVAASPADLYTHSRKLIPDPTSTEHQAIFKDSFEAIKRASQQAEGDTKEGLLNLIKAYRGESDGNA